MKECQSYRTEGLAPLVGANPVVLILGSLPGKESLAKQQYYGNPRNNFWYVLGEVTGTPVPESYPERIAFLDEHRIALWDVLHAAKREGSIDANIREGEPNDITAFLKEHPTIRAIVLNGGKAKRDFRKVLRQNPAALRGLHLYELTSTSPLSRTAGWTPDRIARQWKSILHEYEKV